MATQTVRLLTNAADFPFVSAYAGRSLTTPSDLAPRMPGSFFGAKDNADYSVPQLLYCENILPYAKGVYSIDYYNIAPAISPATVLCDQAIPLRDATENQYTFVPARGANYVWNPVTLAWASVNPFIFGGNLVTRAYVNGRTFICYEKSRIIEYVGGVFSTIALTLPAGLAITDVRGIGSASNYLLLFTDLTIYWCTPLNILDFATIDQGAGQQIPIDIKGQITALLSCSGGFIIYTARNAVSASFTNNAAAPFVYREVQNCGGIASWERATPDADDAGHYIWGTNGLQRVTLIRAESIFPALTDFLVGGVYETWDSSTKVLSQVESSNPFNVKLAFLAGRYLVVSYSAGSTGYTDALIYDITLERWGKLRTPHVDVYPYTFISSFGIYTYDLLPGTYDALSTTYDGLGIPQLVVAAPKRGLAFLRSDGQIWAVRPEFNQTGSGVAIFGRVQQRQSRQITVHEVRIDGLTDSGTPAVTLLGSGTGYARDIATPFGLVENIAGSKRYDGRVTSQNFNVAFEGHMVLSNILMRVNDNGSR